MIRKLRQKLPVFIFCITLTYFVYHAFPATWNYPIHRVDAKDSHNEIVPTAYQPSPKLVWSFRKEDDDTNKKNLSYFQIHRHMLERNLRMQAPDHNVKNSNSQEYNTQESHLHQILMYILSNDIDIQRLPVKIELNCSKNKMVVGDGVVCLEESEIIKETKLMAESITVYYLKRALMNLVLQSIRAPVLSSKRTTNEKVVFQSEQVKQDAAKSADRNSVYFSKVPSSNSHSEAIRVGTVRGDMKKVVKNSADFSQALSNKNVAAKEHTISHARGVQFDNLNQAFDQNGASKIDEVGRDVRNMVKNSAYSNQTFSSKNKPASEHIKSHAGVVQRHSANSNPTFSRTNHKSLTAQVRHSNDKQTLSVDENGNHHDYDNVYQDSISRNAIDDNFDEDVKRYRVIMTHRNLRENPDFPPNTNYKERIVMPNNIQRRNYPVSNSRKNSDDLLPDFSQLEGNLKRIKTKIQPPRNSRENPDIPPNHYPNETKEYTQPHKKQRQNWLPNAKTKTVTKKRARSAAEIRNFLEHKAAMKLSPSLLDLLRYSSKKKSLIERGFPETYNFNSSLDLRDKRKYINEVIDRASKLARSTASTSLNPNLIERGKYQRAQTDLYCQQNNISKLLPDNFMELNALFKHLLYDDKRRIVFCYVPKNGCSNIKRMMLILNGILPASSSQEKRPSEDLLSSAHSFRSLTKEEAIYKLENYYKFGIIRNPMERLLSAYRNKLETPLNYTLRKKFPDRLKAYILKLYEKDSLVHWIASKNYSRDIHPSFSAFLQFMVRYPMESYNEHFTPFVNLCFPCAVNYDVLINLKSMDYDVYAIMKYLGIPESYYPPVAKHVPTSNLLETYFGSVSDIVKTKIHGVLDQELGFYYRMHPEEWRPLS